MSDRPFQRPGSPPHRREEPWPYRSPGVAGPSESAWSHLCAPLPSLQQQGRHPRPTLPTPRLRGAAVVGAVGLLAGMVLEMVVADPTPPRPVPISVASFPVRLLGQVRIDTDWRTPSSAPEVDRIATGFDAQLAAHRFAYGGDGASLDYGLSYTLTIVNGLVAVSLPAAGDPPSGDIPMVVTLRTSDTRCVSEQTHTAFEGHHSQPPAPSWDHMGEADAAAAPGPRSGDRSAWTDCVLMDRQRNLTLRLVGDGPADDINDTARHFRDALQQVHAALVDGQRPRAGSLRSGESSCVSDQPPPGSTEPASSMAVTNEDGSVEWVEVSPVDVTVESECVLLDAERDLSLRLTSLDAVEADVSARVSTQLRDELEFFHALLTA